MTASRIGRGLWRGVYSNIVDHPDFQALTPHARLTLFVCRLGSLAGPASIFRYYREPLMLQTGLTAEELEAALSELEKRPSPSKPWIVRDDAIVWVRNGLKHDPTLSLQHQGHRDAILRALSALPYTPTVKKFFRYYGFARGRGGATTIGSGGGTGGESGGHNSDRTPITKQDKTTPTPNEPQPPTALSVVASSAESNNGQSIDWRGIEEKERRQYGRPLSILERMGAIPPPPPVRSR